MPPVNKEGDCRNSVFTPSPVAGSAGCGLSGRTSRHGPLPAGRLWGEGLRAAPAGSCRPVCPQDPAGSCAAASPLREGSPRSDVPPGEPELEAAAAQSHAPPLPLGATHRMCSEFLVRRRLLLTTRIQRVTSSEWKRVIVETSHVGEKV